MAIKMGRKTEKVLRAGAKRLIVDMGGHCVGLHVNCDSIVGFGAAKKATKALGPKYTAAEWPNHHGKPVGRTTKPRKQCRAPAKPSEGSAGLSSAGALFLLHAPHLAHSAFTRARSGFRGDQEVSAMIFRTTLGVSPSKVLNGLTSSIKARIRPQKQD